MLTLSATWLVVSLSVLFIAVCVLMMLVILIQKPKGGGLSGAFGGAGGANDAFGAKTGDVLTVVTVGFFVAFLLLAMGLTWAIRPDHEETLRRLQQETTSTTAPALPAEDAQPPAEGDMLDERVDTQVNTRVGAELDEQVDTAVPATERNTQETDDYLAQPKPGVEETGPSVPSLIDENAQP